MFFAKLFISHSVLKWVIRQLSTEEEVRLYYKTSKFLQIVLFPS